MFWSDDLLYKYFKKIQNKFKRNELVHYNCNIQLLLLANYYINGGMMGRVTGYLV